MSDSKIILIDSSSKGPSEFHRFMDLPKELQSKIWKFALPSSNSLQISIMIDDRLQDGCIWGVTGSFTMFQVCALSRYEALSIYEPILYTKDHGYIYMERSKPELNSTKQSKVQLMNMSLGYRILESRPFLAEFFWDWPPQKGDGDERTRAWWREGLSESSKRKMFPRRLWGIFGIGGRRRR